MQKLCDLFGKSRQAWYERQKQRDQSSFEYEMLLEKVKTIRRICLGLGQKNFIARENQIAERINRMIKEEILENRSFLSHQHALEEIQRVITSYNSLRPHASCDYLTPEQAHLREGHLRKKWRLTTRRSYRMIEPEELEVII
ncbi:integrase core domain-containing protein [Dyadobacter fermentans]|uniref:integrase core domain-containing protein n=1 Tax=Dyadobacter fermentans TaxID=94254 RepID=UPI001CC16B1B|nr:integrase core domain-containing protein [Dyadobacter fermentans]